MESSEIPCIASFCLSQKDDLRKQKDGILSQWRGYGMDGGYAIVFDGLKMERFFKRECEQFRYPITGYGKVCYDSDLLASTDDLYSKRTFLATIVYRFYRFRLSLEAKPRIDGEVLGALVDCLALLKHRGFYEEQEYRFFVFAPSDKETVEKGSDIGNKKIFKKIAFREACVPYVKLFENEPKLPIEKIVVGPTKDKEKHAESLRLFLKCNGLGDIPVECSSIPYIGIHYR